MAKVIEFYVPNSFSKKVNYTASRESGKLIEFPSKVIQPNSDPAQWQGSGYMCGWELIQPGKAVQNATRNLETKSTSA